MEIPRNWRLKKQRYNLIGDVCPSCDEKEFPPRMVCRKCGYNNQPTDNKSTIMYEFTTSHNAEPITPQLSGNGKNPEKMKPYKITTTVAAD